MWLAFCRAFCRLYCGSPENPGRRLAAHLVQAAERVRFTSVLLLKHGLGHMAALQTALDVTIQCDTPRGGAAFSPVMSAIKRRPSRAVPSSPLIMTTSNGTAGWVWCLLLLPGLVSRLSWFPPCHQFVFCSPLAGLVWLCSWCFVFLLLIVLFLLLLVPRTGTPAHSLFDPESPPWYGNIELDGGAMCFCLHRRVVCCLRWVGGSIQRHVCRHYVLSRTAHLYTSFLWESEESINAMFSTAAYFGPVSQDVRPFCCGVLCVGGAVM